MLDENSLIQNHRRDTHKHQNKLGHMSSDNVNLHATSRNRAHMREESGGKRRERERIGAEREE